MSGIGQKKRKALLSKKSAPATPKIAVNRSFYGPPQTPEYENGCMHNAEIEQTKLDRFWGLDAEAENCRRESQRMQQEDFFSRSYEEFCRTLELHADWELEHSRNMLESAYINAMAEARERKRYLKSLLSVESTDDIINFRWQTREKVPALNSTTPNFQGAELTNMFDRNGDKSVLALPMKSTEGKYRLVSMHLDGLQQSKGLSAEQTRDIVGPTLRNRNIRSVVEDALRPPSIISQPENPATSSNRRNEKPKEVEKMAVTAEEMQKAARMSQVKHIDLIDGHPQYKWDQELMLRIAFNRLDSGRRGYLLQEDMLEIAKNVSVQSFLRLTVFGAWVKRKEWNKFSLILEPARGEPRPHPNSEGRIPYCATLTRWLFVAKAAAKEANVLRRHVRTAEEHKEIATTAGPWLQLLGEGRRGWFADEARVKTLETHERNAKLTRSVKVGDCVWGLHGRGIVWLPAVVERITFSPNSHECFYDLSYCLTQSSYQRAQTKAASRQLLELPSQLTALPHSQGLEKDSRFFLLSKDLSTVQTEREVCSLVFDSINNQGLEAIDSSRIMESLHRPDLAPVVRSSAVLTALLRHWPAAGSDSPSLLLREAFAAVFGSDKIGKTEFIEFCFAAGDIQTFNSTLINKA